MGLEVTPFATAIEMRAALRAKQVSAVELFARHEQRIAPRTPGARQGDDRGRARNRRVALVEYP